jgi:phosphate uptake regulator
VADGRLPLVSRRWTLGVILGMSLLVAGTTVACRPPTDDFRQRRLELEEEIASLAKALDQLDGRLSEDCQRMSAWEERLAISPRSQKRGPGGLPQPVGRRGPRPSLTLVEGPGAKAGILASRP